MSVLRQHTVLLDLSVPTDGPFSGPATHFKPSDADGIADGQHGFTALVLLHRDRCPDAVVAPEAGVLVPGTVPPPVEAPPIEPPDATPIVLSIDGSFDNKRWVRLGGTSLSARDRHVEKVVQLEAMTPYLRVRVGSPKDLKFKFTGYVAVGSSAPYTARSAA